MEPNGIQEGPITISFNNGNKAARRTISHAETRIRTATTGSLFLRKVRADTANEGELTGRRRRWGRTQQGGPATNLLTWR